MKLRGRLAAGGVAVIAVGGSALAASGGETVVWATVDLPSHGKAAVSLPCPAGSLPVEGGIGSLNANVQAIENRPKADAWHVGLLHAGSATTRVRVSAVCLAQARTSIVRRSIGSRSHARAVLRCPVGTTPVGFGWKEAKARRARFGWMLRRALLEKRSVRIMARDRFHSSRRPSGKLTLYASCLFARGRQVQTVRFVANAARGENVFIRSCPPGRDAVGGGFSLSRSALFQGFSVTSLRSARWFVRSGPGTASVSLSLLCRRR
jgi:hypothetical protein